MGMDKSLRKGARRPLSGLSHEPAMRSARTLPASCPYRASAGDHDSAGLTRRFKRCFPLSKFHRALLPPAPSAPLPRLLFFPKSLCRPPQNQARTVFHTVCTFFCSPAHYSVKVAFRWQNHEFIRRVEKLIDKIYGHMLYFERRRCVDFRSDHEQRYVWNVLHISLCAAGGAPSAFTRRRKNNHARRAHVPAARKGRRYV